MNITSLYNVSSDAVRRTAELSSVTRPDSEDQSFHSFLNAAVNQLNETNSYLNKQEEEEIKFSLGLTENSHDLSIAQSKASAALQYTVALRDKFLEAYREIMQMQI
ncbi:flagellar hook-basal body complex protein FliE [bacterium C-53]|nr:flagellar hook-basal body complex protein FliE [Lachnospiraceae bacterium]NBI02107.1 flagellar hook-basal body complex protein FliE [Lachnospiraceae bacterium]RKJ10368.1 flagellar hook-basal body complex protein FliE [bacterium C-53]